LDAKGLGFDSMLYKLNTWRAIL